MGKESLGEVVGNQGRAGGRKLPRALAGLGGILLLGTAYLHSTGTSDVRRALSGAGVEGFFGEALPVIWMFFSWHLSVIATVSLWVAITNPRWFRPATAFCGVVAIGDFFWVYGVAGWFPGTWLLLLVSAVFVVATYLGAR